MSETGGSKTIGATPVVAPPQTAPSIASSLRMKQREKIAELREALVQAGMHTLNEQAAALNLTRSTCLDRLERQLQDIRFVRKDCQANAGIASASSRSSEKTSRICGGKACGLFWAFRAAPSPLQNTYG